MEQGIIGSLDVTLDAATVAPVTLPEAYFGTAEALMPAARLLAVATEAPGTALTLVSGHILECLLKAFLSKNGVPRKELIRKPFHHNLCELWQRSVQLGCPVGPAFPSWAERLNKLYDDPYLLRYPEGRHVLVLPGAQPMTAELGGLLEVVRKAIRSDA